MCIRLLSQRLLVTVIAAGFSPLVFNNAEVRTINDDVIARLCFAQFIVLISSLRIRPAG